VITAKSYGIVEVAILGSASFDASQVDPTTVTVSWPSIPSHPKKGLFFSLEDVNFDGHDDLLLQVSVQDLGLVLDDTEIELLGRLFDGVPVRGSDTVVVH
jgi:hypothetical protein